MASPIVAGASALLLPRIRQMTPPEGMTRMDLLRIILMNTATPLIDVLDSSGHALENSRGNKVLVCCRSIEPLKQM